MNAVGPETPQLSIIVPTYREVANLPPLVAEITREVASVIPAWELIVVDDNSQDGTVEVCHRLQAQGMPLRLVVRTQARGLASAVVAGVAVARGPVLVVMDADLSHPAAAIPQLYQAVMEGAEFVIGSRYVPGGGTDDHGSTYRWLTARVAALLARPLVAVQDPTAGFFAFPRSLLSRCAPLHPVGYKIALELLVKSRATRIQEIPIQFRARQWGTSKLTVTQQCLYLWHLAALYRFHLLCRGASPCSLPQGW